METLSQLNDDRIYFDAFAYTAVQTIQLSSFLHY